MYHTMARHMAGQVSQYNVLSAPFTSARMRYINLEVPRYALTGCYLATALKGYLIIKHGLFFLLSYSIDGTINKTRNCSVRAGRIPLLQRK